MIQFNPRRRYRRAITSTGLHRGKRQCAGSDQPCGKEHPHLSAVPGFARQVCCKVCGRDVSCRRNGRLYPHGYTMTPLPSRQLAFDWDSAA